MRIKLVINTIAFLLLVVHWSCRKEEYATNTDANIAVSTDTISFDTIFTTIGSVTKRFKVYNNNDKYIEMSSVSIGGGSASNFRMLVDGATGNEHRNIVIPPKDSLYILVEVTIDPVGDNLPIVIYDAIVFVTNGNVTKVTLEAFGQDVHFINGKIIESRTWTNDKPYLIYNSMAVDSNHTLTINPGVKVHFHHNSSLIVWGNIIVNGTYDEPVVFEGDRFDLGYGESAGRWGTIYIDPKSTGNEFNYAIIKNATAGFQVGSPGGHSDVPSLLLRNTIVRNTSFASIIAYGAEITGYNCIFSDAQYHGLALIMGGKYNFYHSTISMIGALKVSVARTSYQRKSPSFALVLSNSQPYLALNEYYMVTTEIANNSLVEANFYNSIIYGKNKLEFLTDDNEESEFNYFMDHVILKQLEDSIDIADERYFNEVVLNEYPRFVNDSSISGELDYRLDTLSPAKDIGSIEIVNQHLEYLELDYDGNSRIQDGKPDLGAFERQE